ncbi:MAG: hypothetical protein WC254_02195 [Candidatus Woesearchaeota archaeon]|jgi:hypothetical protein
MKKGDMTIQIVVLAALALIFLFVVVFVMTGKIKIFNTALDDCTNKQGICVSTGTCATEYNGFSGSFSCSNGEECCLNTCEGKGGTCSPQKCTGEEIYLASCNNNQYCCG